MPPKLYRNLKVRGCTSPDGERYINIEHHGDHWFVAYGSLLADHAEEFRSLAEQGLPVAGRGFVAQVMEDVQTIRDFPEREILRHPSWNGPLFGRPDGEVLAPDTSTKSGPTPGIGFYRHPNRCRCDGAHKEWLRRVAKPLGRDDHATVMIGVALAPAIRDLTPSTGPSVAFQFVVDQRYQAVRRVALSVTGSMTAETLAPDPIEKVLRAPERLIEASRGSLLVIGDVAGYLRGGSDKRRKIAVRKLLFDQLLPSGDGGSNAAGQPAPSFITVEDRPLAELLDLDDDAADQLNCLMPIIDLRHGVHVDTGQLELDDPLALPTPPIPSDVVSQMGKSYGVALRKFQRKLVELRATSGLESLQRDLNVDYERFLMNAIERIGRDGPVHLIAPFGLIFTALQAAERLNVIPKGDGELGAVWRVFEQLVVNQPRHPSAADILTEIASRPGVLDVGGVEKSKGKKELKGVIAFTKQDEDGERELWVLVRRKKKTFDWPAFSKLPDFDRWFVGKGEEDRDGWKRVIGGWKNASVLRFKLP